MKTRNFVIFASVAVVAALALSAAVAAQPGEPHLVNPNFEAGFTVREAAEVEVADGWDYAYLSGNDRQCRAPCYRPEFKPEREIVAQGQYSQRWFSTFSRQFAALSQRVQVEPGEWYEFSCDVYAISEPMGQMAGFAGINPWGGSPFERTMVWGKEQVGDRGWVYREWMRVSVTAQVWSDHITVAIGGNNAWPTKNNALYVDACRIKRVDAGGDPEPLPTYTPYPTWTPAPTAQPCPTCAPGSGDCPGIEEIRRAMGTVVADRAPVRWPR